MTVLIDWNKPPGEGHFVRRPYGPPGPWPKNRPATWAPVMLHQTRYAAASTPMAPGVIVTAPRGQEIPVRALGETKSEAPKDTRTWREKHPDATAIIKEGSKAAVEHKGLLTLVIVLGGIVTITLLRTVSKFGGG